MRKIEKEMVKAIKNKKDYRNGGTRVTYFDSSDTSEVYLHGNHIATCRDKFVEVIEKTLLRWNTITTRSRLTALGVPVSSKKFCPTIFGVLLDPPVEGFEVYFKGNRTVLERFEDAEALVKVIAIAHEGPRVIKVGARSFVNY